MTSRELVRRTLSFDAPPRVPRQLWLLPWACDRYPEELRAIQARFPDDIVSAPAFHEALLPVHGDPYRRGTFVDEWGCTFLNVQAGVIGEVKTPLLKSWDAHEMVRFPEERLSVQVDEVNQFCRRTDRFVLAGACPRPFERLQFLRGTENLLMDLIDQPAGLHAFLARLHEFYMRELELWARTDVDALSFMDDWGGQQAMLISPQLWRTFFKPLYRDYVAIAHQSGKAAFMHSDGYILNILPDLVEIGLDALNCQVFCMDVALLGDRFSGKLTFWGELDRQQILPGGSRAAVIAAAQQLRSAFWRPGGFIAQCEFGPGARPENVHAFFEAWETLV